MTHPAVADQDSFFSEPGEQHEHLRQITVADREVPEQFRRARSSGWPHGSFS